MTVTDSLQGTPLREVLASIATSVSSDNLPADVIHQAKRIVLDTLACAYGGYASEPTRIALEMARETGGNPVSSVLVTGERTSAAMATLVNGTMMRYLNANDYYFGRNGSHASGNLSALLAVAEAERRSGCDLLAAFVVAYEMQFRFCDFAGEPNIWDRGWHHATHVQFASAAACGWLMRLPTSKIAEALSISGSLNNTLAQLQRGSIPLMKATAEAQVAKNGLEAAQLARFGLTGPEEIFEGRFGWIPTVAGVLDVDGMSRPIDPSRYRILDTCTKPYAAEFMTQAAIQAAIDIRRKHSFNIEDVDSIEARFHEYAFKKPSWDIKKMKPTNRETADHSFPYCIAVALLEQKCGPDQFRDELITSRQVHDLIDRTSLVVHDRLTKAWPAKAGAGLAITLHDGSVIEEMCFEQPGHPVNRESDRQLEEKLLRLSEGVISTEQAHDVIDAVWTLENVRDMNDFTKRLGAGSLR